MMIRLLLLSYLLSISLFAKPIETFYGVTEVTEPVLLELIESPAFQRLQFIHQYGVSYYTTHREEFTRYAHSLGVFHLLRESHCSLNEQIAGLLHDVSHTVFSHVGDWVFHKEYKEVDYQNSIHEKYLESSGLANILRKYGISPKEVLPLGTLFPALESPRPNTSADRLDYSIQGAYHQNFITHEEAVEIFKDCHYVNGCWVGARADLMEKIIRFTLFMTEDCFGSVTNHLSSRWLADAILRGIELELISFPELHTGIDQVVWDKLLTSNDPFIQSRIHMIFQTNELYTIVDQENADFFLTTKFWGFDPWIMQENTIVRLTSINSRLANDYQIVKDRIARGFSVKLNLK